VPPRSPRGPPLQAQSESAGWSLVLGLPRGGLSRVLDFLDGRSLLRAGAVCQRLRRAVWDAPDSSSLQRWRRCVRLPLCCRLTLR